MISGLKLIVLGVLVFKSKAVREGRVWNVSCGNYIGTVARAVGANFSVMITSTCRTDIPAACRTKYTLQEDRAPAGYVSKKIIVNENTTEGSKIQRYQESGVTISHSYSMTSDNNAVILNLSMVPGNRSVFLKLTVISNLNCDGSSTFVMAAVNFVGCQNNSNIITVDPPVDIVQYLDTGRIICNEHGKGRAMFANESEALQTYCDADAAWKDIENISCLYPIPTNITILGHKFKELITFSYNHSAGDQKMVLNCTSNNATGSPQFMLENEKINETLLIKPNLHGKKMFCYYENDFTKRFGVNMTYFRPSSLEITFGPLPSQKFGALCALTNGSIPFYSNPMLSNTTPSLIVKDSQNDNMTALMAEITTCCEVEYGVPGQMITTNTSLITSNMTIYLRYNESGILRDYKVVSCNESSTTDNTEPVDSTTVPIAIAAAVCGSLFTLLLLLFYKRRQRQEKLASSNTEGTYDHLHKHMVADQTVEMYAAIDRKSEAQGQNNSGFDGSEQNDATYSAVGPKPNNEVGPESQNTTESDAMYAKVFKENQTGEDMEGIKSQDAVEGVATYAEVNKEKKRNKGTSKSALTAPDTVTYAVIERTKKQNKKVIESNVQGTSESTATYAEVNKRTKGKDADESQLAVNPTYAEVNKNKRKQ